MLYLLDISLGNVLRLDWVQLLKAPSPVYRGRCSVTESALRVQRSKLGCHCSHSEMKLPVRRVNLQHLNHLCKGNWQFRTFVIPDFHFYTSTDFSFQGCWKSKRLFLPTTDSVDSPQLAWVQPLHISASTTWTKTGKPQEPKHNFGNSMPRVSEWLKRVSLAHDGAEIEAPAPDLLSEDSLNSCSRTATPEPAMIQSQYLNAEIPWTMQVSMVM